jgi:hypothetical protein
MPCQTCGQPKTFEEFLASLIKIDSNGNYGILINSITIADCETLTNAVSCGQPYDVQELIQKTCSLDDCDNPMINVFQISEQG